MSNEVRVEYIRRLHTLSKSDLQAWENFVVAFNDYVAQELERAAGAAGHEAQIALGMSRRLLELRNDIRNIETIAEKVRR